MVRKCTIIGMSAGLSAFFGVQLGGEWLDGRVNPCRDDFRL